jgi:hypothetical protein
MTESNFLPLDKGISQPENPKPDSDGSLGLILGLIFGLVAVISVVVGVILYTRYLRAEEKVPDSFDNGKSDQTFFNDTRDETEKEFELPFENPVFDEVAAGTAPDEDDPFTDNLDEMDLGLNA